MSGVLTKLKEDGGPGTMDETVRRGLNPRSVLWDLWWIKCHWDMVFSEYHGFLLSV